MSRSLVVVPLLVLAVVGELAWTNFLSFNPSAMSSEGKALARCLSTPSAAPTTCVLPDWSTGAQLLTDPACAGCAANSAGTVHTRYRARTSSLPDGTRAAVVVGVDVYDVLVGDTWVGVRGEALHCIDRTEVPSAVRALVRPARAKRLDDPRCAPADAVLPPPLTKRSLRPG